MATDPVPNEQKQNALIAKFVENQGKELEHRAQEIELEKQKDDHAFEYGNGLRFHVVEGGCVERNLLLWRHG